MNRLQLPSTGVALSALLLLTPFAGRAADVIGRIGQTDVTAAQVQGWLETLEPAERAALARDPGRLSQVVRTFLARQGVLAEARAKRWQEQPAVKAQLDQARDEALVELYLRSVSQPPEGWPGEAEVKAAYDANPGAFELAAQYQVAQVFIAAPAPGAAGGEEKARARLDAAVKRLAGKGADFAAVARELSEDKGSAARGGELGWLTEAQLVPGIRALVLATAKGAVSEPARLEDGWHVVKVLDTKPAGRRPFADVKEALTQALRTDKAAANRRAYLAKLLDQNPPVVNELALAQLMAKAR